MAHNLQCQLSNSLRCKILQRKIWQIRIDPCTDQLLVIRMHRGLSQKRITRNSHFGEQFLRKTRLPMQKSAPARDAIKKTVESIHERISKRIKIGQITAAVMHLVQPFKEI